MTCHVTLVRLLLTSATGYLIMVTIVNCSVKFLIETKIKYKLYAGRLHPKVQSFTLSSAPFFREKVPLSYNNNNMSFICMTIGSYTIAKALGTDH